MHLLRRLGNRYEPPKHLVLGLRKIAGNDSKMLIVDITNPRSSPLELQATVPDYMVPFAPILQQGEQPFSIFVDLQNKYDWVLRPVVGYPSVERLIEVARGRGRQARRGEVQ
jgi:hypothetical protein